MTYEEKEFENWPKKPSQISDSEKIIMWCGEAILALALFATLVN